MKIITLIALALLSLSANSAYLSSVNISPEALTSSDNITATVYGDLANTGSYIINTEVTQESNAFILDIFTTSLGGASVLTSFEYTEILGLLSSGNYALTVNGYIDGNLKSNINTSFSVSEVPLPAASLFFFSGIILLIGGKKSLTKRINRTW